MTADSKAEVAGDPVGDPGGGRRRLLEVVLFVALVAIGLGMQGVAVEAHSISGDGVYHLLAGWQTLERGSNLLNLEHPPLAKMWMALWLARSEDLPTGEPILPDAVLGKIRETPGLFETLSRHRIVARLLLLSATLTPFLLLSYRLGRGLGGSRTGENLVLLLLLCFPLIPLYGFLQTDTGLSAACLATLLAGARWAESGRRRWGLAAGVCAGLGAALKHSGLLLFLLLPVQAALAARRRSAWRTWSVGVAGGVLGLGVLWSSYALANRDYRSDLGRIVLQQYARGEGTLIVEDSMTDLERPILRLESVSPEAAQWLLGLLGIREQNRRGTYPTMVAGTISYDGRWWYFPLLLIVELPLAVLGALVVIGARALSHIRPRSTDWGKLTRSALIVTSLVWVAVYGGLSIASSYNLGLRHLLPVLPFLLLPVARWLGSTGSRARVGFLAVLVLESLLLMPHWHSATNTWWLGAANRADELMPLENLDYSHTMLLLDAETKHLPRPLLVLNQGLSQRTLTAQVRDSRLVSSRGDLPAGWYAINRLTALYVEALCDPNFDDPRGEQLRNFARRWRGRLAEIAARSSSRTLVAGRTFHLFRLDEAVPAGEIRELPCGSGGDDGT